MTLQEKLKEKRNNTVSSMATINLSDFFFFFYLILNNYTFKRIKWPLPFLSRRLVSSKQEHWRWSLYIICLKFCWFCGLENPKKFWYLMLTFSLSLSLSLSLSPSLQSLSLCLSVCLSSICLNVPIFYVFLVCCIYVYNDYTVDYIRTWLISS